MCNATDDNGRSKNNVQFLSVLFGPIVLNLLNHARFGPASERAHCKGYAFQSRVKVAVVTFTMNFLTSVMKISTEL